MKNSIKIIIVDDHQIFRKGVSLQLNELDNIEVVAEANNGEEFLEVLDTVTADLVLMDIKMPIMNGIEATKLALSKYPRLKIVALSMFGEEEYLQNMLDAGAKGFLLKNIAIEELNNAIHHIMNGKNFFSDELLSILTKTFMGSSAPAAPVEENTVANLTKRENEILNLICKGLSNQEIAKQLFLSPRTVDGHRANIISKTGTKNTVSLVTYAIKNKLIEI